MRSSKSSPWARWAICALALSIGVPAAFAKQEKKSLSECTTFAQSDKGEDTVEMTVKNTCSIPLDCTMSWRVVCAPESKKRRNVHPTDAKFSLQSGGEITRDASAAVCGDDPWTIDGIEWSCAPNKE
jgi:hypothetical protein